MMAFGGRIMMIGKKVLLGFSNGVVDEIVVHIIVMELAHLAAISPHIIHLYLK